MKALVELLTLNEHQLLEEFAVGSRLIQEEKTSVNGKGSLDKV